MDTVYLALEFMVWYIYNILAMNEIGMKSFVIFWQLIGSILFAHLITKIISGKNIRDLGIIILAPIMFMHS